MYQSSNKEYKSDEYDNINLEKETSTERID